MVKNVASVIIRRKVVSEVNKAKVAKCDRSKHFGHRRGLQR